MRVAFLVTILSETATIASALTLASHEPPEQIKSKLSSKFARDYFDDNPVSSSNGLLYTRTKSDGSCGNRQADLQAALAECAKRAKGAMEEAQNPSSQYYKQFFKDDTDEARKYVVNTFSRIADECAAGDGGKHIISCIGGQKCEGAAIAWGAVGGNTVRLCDAAFVTKEWCGGVATWDTIIHEFTHNMVETKDITYDVQSTLQLPGKQSRKNASSFNFFAQAVALRCDYGAGGNDNSASGVPDPNDNAIPGNEGNPPTQSKPPAKPAPGNAGSGFPGGNDNAIPGNEGNRPPQSKPPQSKPPARPAPGDAGSGIDKDTLANEVGKAVGENVVIESVERVG